MMVDGMLWGLAKSVMGFELGFELDLKKGETRNRDFVLLCFILFYLCVCVCVCVCWV